MQIRQIQQGITALAVLVFASSPALADSEFTVFLEEVIPHIDETIPEPSPAARAMAITFTAAYDAWAAYETDAVGVVTGDLLDGTGGDNNETNQKVAVLHAMLTALYGVTGKQNPYRQRLIWMGYNPDSESPAAVLGRRVGAAVLAERRQDGSNQSGAYEDTSHYMVAPAEEFEAWQPDWIDRMWQEPLTPHWGRVLPFAIRNLARHMPPAPPEVGTPEFDQQVEEVLAYSRNLTPRQMAIAEYWAPVRWRTPATHLVDISKDISERDGLSFEQDVQMFFIIGNALLDASIAAWEAKYQYNYVRPVTVIQGMGGREITAYSTQFERVMTMPASEWEPYLETPAFPEYVSGHSTFTAAWAQAMELFMGTDVMDYTGRVYYLDERGSSYLASPFQLHYQTYHEAAEDSGLSRLHGGIHWMVGNTEGLRMGYELGRMAFERAQGFINGETITPTPVFAGIDSEYWQAMPEGGRMTRVVDPIPAGTYAISASLTPAGDGERAPVRMSIRAGDGTNRLLGMVDESNRNGPIQPWISLNWYSTGIEPFYVMIEPATPGGDDSFELVQIYQVRLR